MDPQVSTSFIPKKQLVGDSRLHGSAYGFILLILILVFVTSIIAAGAAFAYEQFLKASIVSKQHSLDLAQQAYEPGVIDDLSRLDSRINQAKVLLQKHIAGSAIFTFLSAQTLEHVQFSSFDYALKENGSADIKLNGKADSFSTVALQSDQFGASKVLKDVVFSGISVDPATGAVTFAVSASVDPAFILYANTVTANSTDTSASANSSSTSQSTP